jgi:hypothetical protein
MADRPFRIQSSKPSDETLAAELGPAYVRWRSVLELTAGFVRDWTFGKTGGWMLKIHDRKKALLYLIPLTQGFKLSMVIREIERDAFLGDGELSALHDAISSAAKYPEGFALSFDVDGLGAFGPVELFVRKLIEARA